MATVAAPPAWTSCGNDRTASDPVGCTGITVTDSGRCLAHADPDEQRAYLAFLAPGDDLDLRGTTLTEELLGWIRARTTDPGTGVPEIGAALFDRATFTGTARFGAIRFTGAVRFDAATFGGDVSFDSVSFGSDARFDSVAFSGDACFDAAVFAGNACFDCATFAGKARFDSAFFRADARFESVGFEGVPELGPLVCAGTLDLSTATFGAPVTVRVAAKRVLFRRTRWAETGTVWLRYGQVDMTDAVLDHPLTVAARQDRFDGRRGKVNDRMLRNDEPPPDGVDWAVPRVMSLRGVDAAHLVLTDLHLGYCLFCGTIHLDQLRLEGRCPFVLYQPRGIRWSRWHPVRVSQRLLLAEEQHWRARQPHALRGWLPAPDGVAVVEPAALAALYRALRKSYEDSRNEPGAADFYYGEMEMRRADTSYARAERGLLTAYWALSGYGLRAARALVWLLAAITLTMLVMMLWGLPQDDLSSRSTGTLTGRHITLTTGTTAPLDPTGALPARLTGQRFEGSLRVVINSVFFRSSDQDLTTTGTYTEMAARLTEPILLGLAVLAVRGRVKR